MKIARMLLLFAALPIAVLTHFGCYQYRTVRVDVVDAESGSTISRASARTEHGRSELDVFRPRETRAEVMHGSATLAVVDGRGPTVDVTAYGYLPARVGISTTDIKRGFIVASLPPPIAGHCSDASGRIQGTGQGRLSI